MAFFSPICGPVHLSGFQDSGKSGILPLIPHSSAQDLWVLPVGFFHQRTLERLR